MKAPVRKLVTVFTIASLSFFVTPTNADQISLSGIRLGIVDPAWQRSEQGPTERMFDRPRNNSATGLLLRYLVEAKFGLSGGFETGALGDRARVGRGIKPPYDYETGGVDASWSASLLGAVLDYRYTLADYGFLFGGQLALDTLFSDLEIAGTGDRDRRARNVALTSLRMQLGWESGAFLGQPERRLLIPWLALQMGWSEVKPIDYGDWGSFNVGGWNAALELGFRFGGINRLWDKSARVTWQDAKQRRRGQAPAQPTATEIKSDNASGN